MKDLYNKIANLLKSLKVLPNCSVCKWRVRDSFECEECSAQGYFSCYNVYNNRNCRKLFVNKEEKG